MLTAASTPATSLARRVAAALLRRNDLYEQFFAREAMRIARASREMAQRFSNGGRLLAFGHGCYGTDAQHVSVEFVHPVIVGKRALPALDVSAQFAQVLEVMLGPEDIAMGFGAPEGDPEIEAALDRAAAQGAMTFALPGHSGSYCFTPPTTDVFLHQEMMEMLYHTLWETVHVFLERRALGHDAGAASFLYPYLGQQKQPSDDVLDEVASSIQMKVADDARLRIAVAEEQAVNIAAAVDAMRAAISRGGKLLIFGNGGSATDANDWAVDCVTPPNGYTPIPAISLALEPANITALANDVGTDVIFLRQLIAQAQPNDIAVGISTSGGSRNIVLALEEARRRKLTTVALLGYDGGEILRRGLADHALIVHCDYIPRIQEVQASIYHTIRELMDGRYHANN
jgi:D-sedoheptulose 7-phosphate isomerase